MSESGAVDTAILETLRADAELLALCPDGIQYGTAKPTATRFVLVDREAHTVDTNLFGGAAGETFVYLVAAVMPEATTAPARLAATRIRELLDGARITPAGYGLMAPVEEIESVRPGPDVDPTNPDRRVQQWGGRYQVIVQRLDS